MPSETPLVSPQFLTAAPPPSTGLRWSDIALAAASGGLMSLAFPWTVPYSGFELLPQGYLEPLSLLALIPLLLRLPAWPGRRAFFLGWAAGAVFFAFLLRWPAEAMITFGGLPPIAAWPILSLLWVFLGLFWAVPLWVARRVHAALRWPVEWTLPVFWVASEYARNYLLSGFPWGNVGSSQARTLWLAQLASLGGVYLVAGVVVLSNGVLAAALRSLRERRPVPRVSFSLLLIVLTASGTYGAARLSAGSRWPSGERLRIAAIQGNLDERAALRGPLAQAWVIQRMLAQSRDAASEGARVAVWPEGTLPDAVPVGVERLFGPPLAMEIAGLELIAGAAARDAHGGEVFLRNSAFALDGAGRVLGRYDKRHLVPFGEYVPLAGILPWRWFVPPGVAFFRPGAGHEPLRLAAGPLGVLVCYEAIFPEIARETVERGARLLVNITNDAWYLRSAGPAQHLNLARMRAIETGRYLVRAANCGLSAVFDDRGRTLAILPLALVPGGEARVSYQDLLPAQRLVAEVVLLDAPTVYQRTGDAFALLCVLASAAGLIGALIRGRRQPAGSPPIPA
ncbi:MAG: apolipoprotein N-acyltransferase [Myxococcales bacterium]|nr:apolipoprotein N-acyltransferase [Myxococcales bacterium]